MSLLYVKDTAAADAKKNPRRNGMKPLMNFGHKKFKEPLVYPMSL